MIKIKLNMMRKITIFIGFILIPIILSCQSEDPLLDKIRTINDIPFSTEVTVSDAPPNIFSIPIPTTISIKDIIAKKVGVEGTLDQVEDIKLKSMKFKLVSCDDHTNFNFIENISLSLKTEELEEKEVAVSNNVPKDVNVIEMTTTEDFLDDYIKADQLELIMKFKSTEYARNLVIDISMKFDVKVKPGL